jgi:hypothetical protein
MRDIASKDYSKWGGHWVSFFDNFCFLRIIMDWAKDKSRGLPDFSSRKMEETRFHDLSVCLGKPYVYVHQGDCEHVVMVSDIRILHPSECHDISVYPLVIEHPRSTTHSFKCRACGAHKAWSVHFKSLLLLISIFAAGWPTTRPWLLRIRVSCARRVSECCIMMILDSRLCLDSVRTNIQTSSHISPSHEASVAIEYYFYFNWY